MSWTVRMTLKMRDVVDGDLLRQAVELARQRYPYYQVKLGIRKDDAGTEYFVYEDNSEPWVVSEGEKPVQLIATRHLTTVALIADFRKNRTFRI